MAFATVDDVAVRAAWTLTDAQRTRAAALLDDAAAEIHAYAPNLPDDSDLGKATSCQAVLRALRIEPGLRSKTVGQTSETYAGDGGGGVALTAEEIALLIKAKRPSAFSITPYLPPDDEGEPEPIA